MALLNITEERPDNAIRAIVEKTIADAKAEWNLPYEGEYPIAGIGISELRPRHVGLGTDKWQVTLTTSYADWINHTVSDNAYVVVTGLFDRTPDPQTIEVFPSANGLDFPRINIEQMYTFDQARAWFTKPFAVKSDGNITVQVIGKSAQTDQLGLLGYCVAKKAYLIAATPS